MDCEGFDEVVLDLVYDDGPPWPPQLDEARRHAEGCPRCSTALSTLRQARAAADLTEPPVPAGLERRILDEIDRRQRAREATWWGRIDRLISVLGAYAMRPQTAMGVLLLLMTGLSLILLRVRPADRGSVRITENGVPANEGPPVRPSAAPAVAPIVAAADAVPARKDDDRPGRDGPRERDPAGPRERDPAASGRDVAEPTSAPSLVATATATSTATPAAPVATASATAASADSGQEAAYAAAMEHYKARRYADALRAFDVVASGGGSNSGLAALHAARSARYSSGCSAALPRLDALMTRQVGSSAAEATWEAASCYREIGQIDRARQLYSSLRRVAGYRDRVEKELATIEQRDSSPAAGAGKAAPAAAARPAGTHLTRRPPAPVRSTGVPK
jgi:hypothetical protein